MDTAEMVAYLDLTAEYIIQTDHVTVGREKCLFEQCHRSLATAAAYTAAVYAWTAAA